MFLGPGVELIGQQDQLPALAAVRALSTRHDSRVYTVDTNWQRARTQGEIFKAIIDAMLIPEWFGYPPDVAMAQCLTEPNIRMHILVVALTESNQRVLTDEAFVRTLTNVASEAARAGKQFRVMFFEAPLVTASSRL